MSPVPVRPTAVSAEEGPPLLQLEKYIIAPRMFKHLVGRGHAAFSSGRQQDASEYFQFLLDYIDRGERVSLGPRLGASPTALSTPSVFKFELEERYQCSVTGQVRYVCGNQTAQNLLELHIPLDGAVNKEEVAAHQLERKRKLDDCSSKAKADEGLDEAPKLIVPFGACLESYFQEGIVDYRNPSLGADCPMTTATRSVRFNNFPRYLMVKLGRYYMDTTWAMRKIDAEVPVPERLDLSHLRARGGLQTGETPMPEASTTPAASSGGGVEVPDEGIVGQLMAMGFSENGSRRAALATHNVNADAAMGWVLEHLEDPDFNSPLDESPAAAATGGDSAGGVDMESLGMLLSFGYNDKQCIAALKATNNNVER